MKESENTDGLKGGLGDSIKMCATRNMPVKI